MKIIICGSMSFSKEMLKIANKLKQNNHEVILPHNAEKYAEESLTSETSSKSTENKIKNDLIRGYYKEIKNADAILVTNFDKNNIKNYIGGNSFLEIGYAHVLNKLIFLLNNIPEMPYSEEIKAMQPLVINNDLSQIK
jgi:nucleoside 2-deoxyribosyltransferase